MLAFLFLSLAPLTVTSLFFLHSHKQDLLEQSHSLLISVRDNKQQQVNSYLHANHAFVMSFVRSELAFASGGRFYGLVNAFQRLGADIEEARKNAQQRYVIGSGDQIKTSTLKESQDYVGSERYRLLHKRYHWAYTELLKRSEFDDILLVDLEGNVTYSNLKLANFGTNLSHHTAQESTLSQTFYRIKSVVAKREIENETPVIMSDFSPDGSGKRFAWLAAPIIQQGYLHSYALLRLPMTGLSSIVVEQDDNATTKTLLVGSDYKARTEKISEQEITDSSEIIQLALMGESNEITYLNGNHQAIISAFAPIDSEYFRWALITQIPEYIAYHRIHQLEIIFLLAMLSAVIIVFISSHYFSRLISDPILQLAWAAEKVSAGDLNESITHTERRDEIGRLAASFERMQRSIREKIATIKTQNRELEKNLSIIKKQNQDLQRSDKLKDEFLATTSHELRTPLHGMIGVAESLISGSSGPLMAQQRYQLEIIVNSGQRLSNLVNDLLDYHKMAYGEIEFHASAVDLGLSTSLVLALSNHLIGKKALKIINQVPVDLPYISADPQRLEQVLYNLIGNAIKYTNEGKIIISAQSIENSVRIQIVDTGQGISADALDRIFEPLSQASSDPRQYHQGAGLGLSISKQLVELMGGALYVSSQPQVGTTFSFTLPQATEAEIIQATTEQSENHFRLPIDRAESTAIKNSNLPENQDGALLIVVDDEPVNLQILDSFLRMEGYRVKTAANGADAITLIEEEQPELLLLDVMMPGMSGYEVCEHLRHHYDHAKLPIIMLTALSQSEDKIRGFSVGANDYLTKPFNKLELAARISAHLSASKAEARRIENSQLQQEILKREKVEANLLETQGRLLEQLDTAPEAILCCRKDFRIRFANEEAIRLLGRSLDQLKRASIDEFIDPHYLSLPQSHFCGDIEIRLTNQSRILSTDILQLPEGSDIDVMIIISNHNHPSDLRIEQLETVLDALTSYAFEGDKAKLESLQSLGEEFSQLTDRVSQAQGDAHLALRETVVEAMNCALAYWELTTQKTKFDFAEQSGLWRVYLDRSTLQTRTLDKYFHLESLPKTPRWRTVLSTIDFILEKTNKETTERRELIRLRNKIKQLLTK